MRSTRQARIGDTMYIPEQWKGNSATSEFIPLSGYESAKQMLFASVFPVNSTDLEALFAAVDKLCLNDSSISVVKDLSASSSLGSGLRCAASNNLFIFAILVMFCLQMWVFRLLAYGGLYSALAKRV